METVFLCVVDKSFAGNTDDGIVVKILVIPIAVKSYPDNFLNNKAEVSGTRSSSTTLANSSNCLIMAYPQPLYCTRQTHRRDCESARQQEQASIRTLAIKLDEISKCRAESYIVSGVNHLPRVFDPIRHLPDDIRRDQHLRELVTNFFLRETSCECRIRDCAVVLNGFANIMVCFECVARSLFLSFSRI